MNASSDGRGLLISVGLDYVRRFGWSIIPVDRLNKRPLITKWKWCQRVHPKKRDLARWQDTWPDAGLAIITGTVSGGLYVIDADGQAAIDEIEKLGVPWCPIATTPRGGRHYFFHAEGKHPNAAKLGECRSIDIRAEHGYVVGAPTQNGVGSYAWVVRPDSNRSLSAPPAWIFSMQSDKAPHRRVVSDRPQPNPMCPALSDGDDELVLQHVAPEVRDMVLSNHEDRSKADIIVISALKRAGFDLDTIEAIYEKYPVGDKYRERLEECGPRTARAYLNYAFDKVRDDDAFARTVVTVKHADLNTYEGGHRRIYLALIEDESGRMIRSGVTVPTDTENSCEARFNALFQAARVAVKKNVEKCVKALIGKKIVVELHDDDQRNPVKLFLPIVA